MTSASLDPVSFTVLTICTGNICRSPAAEYLLRERLGPGINVVSAGTSAVVGHGVEAQMAALLPMDTSAFAAQSLTPRLVREADLILGLTRFHRALAVELVPMAVRRAFTLREFARIVAGMKIDEQPSQAAALAELTRQAPELRVAARAQDPVDDDIADPYRQSDEVFAQCSDEITVAVRTIANTVERSTAPDGPSGPSGSTEPDRSTEPNGSTTPGKYDWWTKEAR